MQLYGKDVVEPYLLANGCLDNTESTMVTEDACHFHTHGKVDYE